MLLAAHLLSIDRGNRLANQLFALMLIGLSIRIGKSVFNYYLVIEPWQRNIGLAGLLLVGPSFWLYGKTISQKLSTLSKRELFSFAPAVVYALFCWLIPNDRGVTAHLSYTLVMSQWAIYLYLSMKLTSQINRVLTLDAGAWYRKIFIGLCVVWSYYFLVFIGVVPYYLGGAVIYSMMICGLTVLFLNRQHFSTNKYLQTKLSSQQSKDTMTRIELAMIENQLYLDSGLTVAKVAAHLNVSARQVSRAINENGGFGFAAFVKQHRLDHAKRLLSDPNYRRSKIAAIATDSGFGNVASFNSAFASEENITPSEYRKRRIESIE
ncbi:hypothetical protein NBRC116583_12080 [Arenicella sp. 4NH20-0111]